MRTSVPQRLRWLFQDIQCEPDRICALISYCDFLTANFPIIAGDYKDLLLPLGYDSTVQYIGQVIDKKPPKEVISKVEADVCKFMLESQSGAADFNWKLLQAFWKATIGPKIEAQATPTPELSQALKDNASLYGKMFRMCPAPVFQVKSDADRVHALIAFSEVVPVECAFEYKDCLELLGYDGNVDSIPRAAADPDQEILDTVETMICTLLGLQLE